MSKDELAKMRALEAFARAVDASTVFEWGAYQKGGHGERIAEIRADRMEEPGKVRRIQSARNRLVDFGVLEAVA
jgi:hypothetical protein